MFSRSCADLASTATEITGSGNSIRSSVMTLFASHSVSPVVTSFKTDRRGDVAGAHLGDLVTVVRVHLHHAPDALVASALTGLNTVSPQRSTPEYTRKNVSVPTDRIVCDLEREPGERRVVARLAPPRRYTVGENTFDRSDLGRRRQVVDDRVEHRLHAFVPEGGTAQRGNDLVRDRALAQAASDLCFRRVRRRRDTSRSSLRSLRPQRRRAVRATIRTARAGRPALPSFRR